MNNIEPLLVLPDRSELWVGTRHAGEGSFTCELYVAAPALTGGWEVNSVSGQLEATTCLGAQKLAYKHAQRLYPHAADRMKEPPYLVWPGPERSSRPARTPERVWPGSRSHSER